jgi:putative transposase
VTQNRKSRPGISRERGVGCGLLRTRRRTGDAEEHSVEQILRALRQAEAGAKVSDICREFGISDATFYIWKKKYSGLALSELRELRQLREENGKLKRLVADLSLDRHILQEIVQKKL